MNAEHKDRVQKDQRGQSSVDTTLDNNVALNRTKGRAKEKRKLTGKEKRKYNECYRQKPRRPVIAVITRSLSTRLLRMSNMHPYNVHPGSGFSVWWMI